MKCPKCEAEVEGRFCGFCGEGVDARSCSACASPVPSGFRFCGECGEAVESVAIRPSDLERGATKDAGDQGLSDRQRWWIAGAAVAGALLFLSVPYVWTGWAEGGSDVPRMPMNSLAPAPATGVDLSSMTPREAADRLFNRVMAAQGAGDAAEVTMFLPMAIDAHLLVTNLDADGHFHLSLLQQAAGSYRDAMETAERVLTRDPDHLLALYAAGEAARMLGDLERARLHFGRLSTVYDAESRRNLPEYLEHGSFLVTIRETADRFLASPGS